MFISIGYAEIVSFDLDEEGTPLYKIKEGLSIYDKVPCLMLGGTADNLSFRPLPATSDRLINPKDYVGCTAVIIKHANQDPIIIGTVSSPVNEREHLTKDREYDLDGQLSVEKQCVNDETSKLDGSFRSMGAQGISLDTTSNEEPIRLQVADSSNLRISQKGRSTTDHIVLASRLMERLSDLESVIEAMSERVNLLSDIIAEQEEALAIETAAQNAAAPGSVVVHIPRITSLDPAISSWTKGSDASYQADCARISNKSREDIL